MASLLDMVVIQRNPRLAGLLGDGSTPPMQQQIQTPSAQPLPMIESQQAAPQPERRGGGGVGGALEGGLGFLGEMLTGPEDPRLSEEQNAAARRQGLITAGLAALSGRGHDQLTFGEAALTGRQVAGAQRDALVQETARRRQLANISRALGTGRMNRAGVEKALKFAISQGNHDAAKILQDTLSEYPEEEDPTEEMDLVKIDPFGSFLQDNEWNLYDPFSKELVTEPPDLPEDQEVSTHWETLYDEGSGTMQRVRFVTDKNTGEILGRQVVGTAEAPEEVQEGDLAGMANQLERNLSTLSNVLDEDGVPNRLHNWSPNEFKPAWVRRYEAAAGNIDILASRMMFGARVSDSEREALSDVLTPRAGDDQSTIQQKMRNLEVLVDDFKKQQGIFNQDREEGSGGLGRYGLSGSVSAAGPDPFGDLGG